MTGTAGFIPVLPVGGVTRSVQGTVGFYFVAGLTVSTMTGGAGGMAGRDRFDLAMARPASGRITFLYPASGQEQQEGEAGYGAKAQMG